MDQVVGSLLLRQNVCNGGDWVGGKSRKIVVDWLMDLVREERLDMGLVNASMGVMDRMGVKVKKNQLQLLASAALSAVVKARGKELEAEKIAMYADNSITKEEILAWETLCLVKMDWKVNVVVGQDFVDPLILHTNLSQSFRSTGKIIKRCSNILMALSCSDVRFNSVKPSLLAVSSIYMAIEHSKDKTAFVNGAHEVVNESVEEIVNCAKDLEKLLIDTMPEKELVVPKDQVAKKKKKKSKSKIEKCCTNPPQFTSSTPRKKRVILEEITENMESVGRVVAKDAIKDNFEDLFDQCSGGKENDDSAIMMNCSLFENLHLSNPSTPRSSPTSSAPNSAKSSPDSGASVSSMKLRI